jgi:AraC family transcriptional regulator
MSLLAAGDDDVGRVAGALGVSREHLARLFRARVGEPPARWRRRLRLERAERRVLAGEPIAAIARACGFATPAHFAAAFRARTGMTPTRFRASALRR